MAIHSKADALAAINALSEKDFADGIFVDIPKKRRRAQAMKRKDIRIQLPADLQKRVATQVNRYVELLGKELGWTVIALLLEYPNDVRLKALGEHEGYEL